MPTLANRRKNRRKQQTRSANKTTNNNVNKSQFNSIGSSGTASSSGHNLDEQNGYSDDDSSVSDITSNCNASPALDLKFIQRIHRRYKYDSSYSNSSEINAGTYSGIKGMENVGNTCFINAALQALVHITPLKEYFLNVYFRRVRFQEQITIDALFDNLVRCMWNQKQSLNEVTLAASSNSSINRKSAYEKRLISTVIVNSTVSYIWNRLGFQAEEQHDSHEFLRCILNDLHEGLKFPKSQPVSKSKTKQQHSSTANNSRHKRIKALCHKLIEYSRDNDLEEDYCRTIDCFLKECAALKREDDGNIATAEITAEMSEDFDATVPSSSWSSSSCSTSPSSPLHCSAGTVSTISQITGTAPFSKYQSIISDTFTGELENRIRCINCNNVSIQIEAFQDLSIPVNIVDNRKPLKTKFNYDFKKSIIESSKSSGTCSSQSVMPPRFGPLSNMLSTSVLGPLLSQWPFSLALKMFEFYSNFFWTYLSSLFQASVNLDDCLEMFFNSELLDNENRYSCEKCRKLTNCMKYIRIRRLPPVLMIHLNRFESTKPNVIRKINTPVNFPLVNLSLKRYLANDSGHHGCNTALERLHSSSASSSVSFGLSCFSDDQSCCVMERNSRPCPHHNSNQEDKEEDSDAIYELVSVICHHGSQVSQGHYICYACNDINMEWYKFDDIRVEHVSKNEVLSMASSAYILFYQRMNTPENSTSLAAINVIKDIEKLWLSCYLTSHTDLRREFHLLSGSARGGAGMGPNQSNFSNLSTNCHINLHSFPVSKYWLNGFLNFFDPGPIDNSDALCQHGRIRPSELLFFNSLTVPLLEPVGQFLLHLYGGGPTFDRKKQCELLKDNPICLQCLAQLDLHIRRRFFEQTHFNLAGQSDGQSSNLRRIGDDGFNSRSSLLNRATMRDLKIVISSDSHQSCSHSNVCVTSSSGTLDDPVFYIVSEEWIHLWLNYVNIDIGSNYDTINRQLRGLFERQMKVSEDADAKSGDSNSSNIYRTKLHPVTRTVYPPLSALIQQLKHQHSLNNSMPNNTQGYWPKANTFDQQQLIDNQVNLDLHTVNPPGPIDNWQLFGLKSFLLNSLKKCGKLHLLDDQFASDYDFEPLCRTIIQSMREVSEHGDSSDLTDPEKALYYHFRFMPQTHGGIGQEKRCCSFYILSKHYWNFWSSIYGGGPVITFRLSSLDTFSLNITGADVRQFIRQHYRGERLTTVITKHRLDALTSNTFNLEANFDDEDDDDVGENAPNEPNVEEIETTTCSNNDRPQSTPVGQIYYESDSNSIANDCPETVVQTDEVDDVDHLEEDGSTDRAINKD